MSQQPFLLGLTRSVADVPPSPETNEPKHLLLFPNSQERKVSVQTGQSKQLLLQALIPAAPSGHEAPAQATAVLGNRGQGTCQALVSVP